MAGVIDPERDRGLWSRDRSNGLCFAAGADGRRGGLDDVAVGEVHPRARADAGEDPIAPAGVVELAAHKVFAMANGIDDVHCDHDVVERRGFGRRCK